MLLPLPYLLFQTCWKPFHFDVKAAHLSGESHANRTKTTKNIKRSKPAVFSTEKGDFSFLAWTSNKKRSPAQRSRNSKAMRINIIFNEIVLEMVYKYILVICPWFYECASRNERNDSYAYGCAAWNESSKVDPEWITWRETPRRERKRKEAALYSTFPQMHRTKRGKARENVWRRSNSLRLFHNWIKSRNDHCVYLPLYKQQVHHLQDIHSLCPLFVSKTLSLAYPLFVRCICGNVMKRHLFSFSLSLLGVSLPMLFFLDFAAFIPCCAAIRVRVVAFIAFIKSWANYQNMSINTISNTLSLTAKYDVYSHCFRLLCAGERFVVRCPRNGKSPFFVEYHGLRSLDVFSRFGFVFVTLSTQVCGFPVEMQGFPTGLKQQIEQREQHCSA